MKHQYAVLYATQFDTIGVALFEAETRDELFNILENDWVHNTRVLGITPALATAGDYKFARLEVGEAEVTRTYRRFTREDISK